MAAGPQATSRGTAEANPSAKGQSGAVRQGPTQPASADPFPCRSISKEALRRAAADLALTTRQAEIALAVLGGGTETSIASQAGISANTEHTHRRRLFEKLRVHSAPALALCLFGEMLAAGIPPCLGLSPACPELGLAAVADVDAPKDEGGRRRPSPAATILSHAVWGQIAASLRLTRRELGLARGVFDQTTRDAMAADLGLSAKTVKSEMRHLFAKLGVHNRSGLIVRIFGEVPSLGIWPRASLPPECRQCPAAVAGQAAGGDRKTPGPVTCLA